MGTWSWFVALLSLLLAGNLVTCRYLFWDAFYDLYAGRYILQHGIPHQNLITVASYRAAWEDQQWLAQVLSYARRGGPAGTACWPPRRPFW